MVSDAISDSIVGAGLHDGDPDPTYQTGQLYYFSQYYAVFTRYTELSNAGEDASEIFNLDANFKDSKRLSLNGMQKELK